MQFWYSVNFWAILLSPFSFLFWIIISVRKKLYQTGLFKSYRAPIPVFIIGNISVGGNGKTPLVIWLTQKLQQQGFKVGVISRGYGAKTKDFPAIVTPETNPEIFGDEPVLIANRTNAPVCIAPNRQQSIEKLQNEYGVDLIISDDGLQHYALQRDMEIIVIDGKRRFGNKLLLPAGPLREPIARLKTADILITNGGNAINSEISMSLKATNAVNILSGEARPLTSFSQINAIAGIGYPPRFFNMLQDEFKLTVQVSQAFSDHKAYTAADFNFKKDEVIPLLMTEKDAVKCRHFAKENWWYVPIDSIFREEDNNYILQLVLAKLGQKYD